MDNKSYKDLLSEAMESAAEMSNTVFCGQAVSVEGTAMRSTLKNIAPEKLIEFPVDEDFQMGFCTGLAIAGYLPICIFPRWNFLLVATNQIVNYLDKIKDLTGLEIPPKVIIRTAIGSQVPLDPRIQHVGDYTDAFKVLLNNINIVRIDSKEQIIAEYNYAIERKDGVSTLLVESADLYNT